MGPKKGKDPLDEENYWRTCIEEAALDEDKWKVKVVLFEAAGSDQDRIYLDKFEAYAAEERRFVIKNICKTETIFMVNQLGGDKKVKDDNLRVFEEGQAYLKEKKDIPPDILALIVKHLILKMKSEYLFIKHQRLEVREGIQRESTTMIKRAEVRGTVNVKPPEPPEPPEPPPKGKKGAEPDEKSFEFDENKKYNTLLRVRGEEWRDKVYIDDYPRDGPNLYVAVTGFMEPNLAGCFVKIGIPLTAVVQIRIDPVDNSVPSSLFRASKRGQSQTEVFMEKSLKFWEDLQQLRIHKLTADDYKNTAFIVFSPPYWNNDSLSGSPDKIYDELCYLMYDIQDLTRQHSHYIDNMAIINIPEENKDNRYQAYYNKLLDEFPLESVTPYLVLDGILHTICNINLDGKSTTSSLTTALTFNQSIKGDGKLQKAEILVKDIIGQLCKIDSDKKKYRFTYGEEYENLKNPVVIIYGDICKFKTFHLGNINLDNIVWSMLFGMPINKLWLDKNKPTGELEAKINFHVNVLLSCFDRNDVETAELNRLLHVLACRKLYNNRSSLKKEHLLPTNITEFKKAFLKRSVLAEPLTKLVIKNTSSCISPSFPSMVKSVEGSSRSSFYEDDESNRIKFLFDCPDISELVSASEIATDKPINHMIDDFEYFEDFSGTVASQILLEAFNNFNCINYKYCEVTDCIILMFFNSYDKDRIAREEWRCHVSTPLCLEDFFDFVLEEHLDWIQNEEKVYDESVMLKSMSECKDSKDLFAAKSCVENMEVDMELLMEGSLKFEEITQIEAVSPETSETKSITAKKVTSPPTTTYAESKSSKKSKSPATLTPKFDETFNQGKTDAEEIKKPFSGYDLGDRRVEVFGKDSIYFSKDGTRVSTFYSLLIPMNFEYVILNVVPGNGYNEFWMHKALDEFVTSEVTDICESFRINCKNQVNIYIKKQSYQVPMPLLNTSHENTRFKDFSTKSPDLSDTIEHIFETRSFHSFYVTWPNGLITESVHEDNSPTLSHIKQYYTSNLPGLNEDMRCVSLIGEVIIFNPNGEIEILKPDSSYIKITKCQKRIVSEEIEEVQSVASSDKSKKGKGKDKLKEKPSKTSYKSSKNAMVEEETKPVEYELFIEEYESIETNGLRQKWVNGNTIDIEKLLIKTATDYCLGEVFSKRMDGTNILLSKDGVNVVTFPNNTRILTSYIIEDAEVYPEWTEEEIEYFSMLAFDLEVEVIKSKSSQKSFAVPFNNRNSVGSSISEKHLADEGVGEEERNDGYISIHIIYSIEHPNFTTITLDKSNGKIHVDSPNNSSVIFNNDSCYEFSLGSKTSVTFNGENLNISYEACTECNSFTTCNIKIKSDEISSVTQIQRCWLKMNDSFCEKIAVNEEGNINVIIQESCCDKSFHDKGSEFSVEILNSTDKSKENKAESTITNLNGKCREMYEAKSLRFFVLRRELTCSELVHRALIDEYKSKCRWKPWCSINQYDTFGDHRSLWSILCPIHLNETEKWLMDSKLSNKPKNLTYKDLEKDSGKGFYHWMRPYKRFQPKPIKPNNVLPERLPRAYVLRTLEQQWRDGQREELNGAKELLQAILRYRHVMETDSETILNVPILDQRTEDERTTDEIVQAIAHKVYEDLKARLKKDVQSRARPSITTELPQPEDASIEGEMDEETKLREELRLFEEEREAEVKEAESADQLPSNLKRYWRRRDEEFKEEQFYRYLLREGSVPPYFRNVLGGAIWWEMNNATDNAVIKAERRKMRCQCAEEASTVLEQPLEH